MPLLRRTRQGAGGKDDLRGSRPADPGQFGEANCGPCSVGYGTGGRSTGRRRRCSSRSSRSRARGRLRLHARDGAGRDDPGRLSRTCCSSSCWPTAAGAGWAGVRRDVRGPAGRAAGCAVGARRRAEWSAATTCRRPRTSSKQRWPGAQQPVRRGARALRLRSSRISPGSRTRMASPRKPTTCSRRARAGALVRGSRDFTVRRSTWPSSELVDRRQQSRQPRWPRSGSAAAAAGVAHAEYTTYSTHVRRWSTIRCEAGSTRCRRG